MKNTNCSCPGCSLFGDCDYALHYTLVNAKTGERVYAGPVGVDAALALVRGKAGRWEIFWSNNVVGPIWAGVRMA